MTMEINSQPFCDTPVAIDFLIIIRNSITFCVFCMTYLPTYLSIYLPIFIWLFGIFPLFKPSSEKDSLELLKQECKEVWSK